MMNTYHLYCPHCNCKIIRAHMGQLISDHPLELPLSTLSDTKIYNEWCLVNDMYDFENIAFTNTMMDTSNVNLNYESNHDNTNSNNNNNINTNNNINPMNTIRYLTCADCEKQVIGIAWMNEKKYYVAMDLLKKQQVNI